MGSLGAMQGLGADRYATRAVSERRRRQRASSCRRASRAASPTPGTLGDVVYQLVGGLRSRHGLRRRADVSSAAHRRPLHARHDGRPRGEPPPRRDDHQGSPELPARRLAPWRATTRVPPSPGRAASRGIHVSRRNEYPGSRRDHQGGRPSRHMWYPVRSGDSATPISYDRAVNVGDQLRILIDDLLGDDARRALIAYHRLVADELPGIEQCVGYASPAVTAGRGRDWPTPRSQPPGGAEAVRGAGADSPNRSSSRGAAPRG